MNQYSPILDQIHRDVRTGYYRGLIVTMSQREAQMVSAYLGGDRKLRFSYNPSAHFEIGIMRSYESRYKHQSMTHIYTYGLTPAQSLDVAEALGHLGVHVQPYWIRS